MSKVIKETKIYYIVKLTDRGDDRYLCLIRSEDLPHSEPSQSSFPRNWASRFDTVEEIPKIRYKNYDIIKVTEEKVIIEKIEETVDEIRGWRD